MKSNWLLRRLRFANDISVKFKLMIIYSIVVIIPICIIGYFLTHKLYSSSIANTSAISNATLNQLKNNYIVRINANKTLLEGLVNYKPLVEYVETNYANDYEAIDDFNAKINPFVRRAELDGGDILIRIYSNNQSIWHSAETSNKLSDLANEKWYDGASSVSSNSVKWFTTTMGMPAKNYIGCYKSLKSLSNPNEVSAVFVVFFKESQLYSLISAEKEVGKVVFLFDNNGKIITSTEQSLLFGDIHNEVFNGNQTVYTQSADSIIQYKDKSYIFYKTDFSIGSSSINNWTLVYLIPATQVLDAIRSIWISSAILCLVCIIAAFILIFLVSYNITGRIQYLINKIKTIVDRNFVIDETSSGKDEVGVLENSFFTMVQKIRTLIDEVYIANLRIKDTELNYQKIQAEKRKAEIIALQSQINPHYLFNTLETIRMSLVLVDDHKNANIIEAFAESFRLCIENRKDMHSIREELLFIQNYITIQKYRFNDMIQFMVDIPDGMMDYSIPKLILQPLIENAVFHGLEMKGEKGTVEIKAYECDGLAHIIVADDGVGITPEDLARLVEGFDVVSETQEQSGWRKIALKNVHQRLRLIYGEEYGLKLSSKLNEGTTAEINFRPINLGE